MEDTEPLPTAPRCLGSHPTGYGRIAGFVELQRVTPGSQLIVLKQVLVDHLNLRETMTYLRQTM